MQKIKHFLKSMKFLDTNSKQQVLFLKIVKVKRDQSLFVVLKNI